MTMKCGTATIYRTLLADRAANLDLQTHSAGSAEYASCCAFADFGRWIPITQNGEFYKYVLPDTKAVTFGTGLWFEPECLASQRNPYEVFQNYVLAETEHCPAHFVVNDAFCNKALPKVILPEGVMIFNSLKGWPGNIQIGENYYGKLADTSKDRL